MLYVSLIVCCTLNRDNLQKTNNYFKIISVSRIKNVREYRRDNQKTDNAEKLVTQDTQAKEKQIKDTTQYVLDTTIRKQTQITRNAERKDTTQKTKKI